MAVVLKAHGVYNHGIYQEATGNRYLQSWDIEAFDGRGTAEFTGDINQAFHFKSAKEAMDAWNSIPKARPKRSDGAPNKPLTAFTMEIVKVPERKLH